MTTTSRARRGLATLAVGALAAGTLGAVGAAPAQAAPDPRPAAAGVTWLAGQLTDGLIVNDQFDFTDYGLTVDAGLALAEVGDDATVDEISAALAPEVRSYYTYEAAPGKTHVSAGSLAKAAAFVQDAGDDPAAYGGQDLVSQLVERVSTDAASAGRIGDVFFPEVPFEADFSNTIGQAFAAHTLDEAGNAQAAAVTDYLLAQQCDAGYFRLDLGATAAATCDADAGEPSTDVTGLAVLNLLSQRDDAEVDAAVDAAVAWLQRTQNRDGSFGSDAQIATANANSTGLAGWALGEAGTPGASSAAIWLRQHQVAPVTACPTAIDAEAGAIAYDDAALTAGREKGIEVTSQDQFRRAAAQALPALRYVQDGPRIIADPPPFPIYRRAGTTTNLSVWNVPPGSTVCITGHGVRRLIAADDRGVARTTVTVRPGSRSYGSSTSEGENGYSFAVSGLAAKKLSVKLGRKQARTGVKQTIRVSGLAEGERVVVRLNGKKVGQGVGSRTRNGTFVVRATTPRKNGKATVRVVGEFNNRVGSATYRVVR